MKICSLCKTGQPLSSYWKRPEAKDGLRAACKSCYKQQQESWLSKNADRKRSVDRDLHQKNKTVRNQRSREYYASHKEAHRKNRTAYSEKNSDRLKEKKSLNRQNNIETIRAKNRQHYHQNKRPYVLRARMREKHIVRATPTWADLDKIEAIYDEAARLTRETGIKHHVDHFYPLRSKTMCGLHVETNLQILTAVDNLRKSNKPPVSESIGAL